MAEENVKCESSSDLLASTSCKGCDVAVMGLALRRRPLWESLLVCVNTLGCRDCPVMLCLTSLGEKKKKERKEEKKREKEGKRRKKENLKKEKRKKKMEKKEEEEKMQHDVAVEIGKKKK